MKDIWLLDLFDAYSCVAWHVLSTVGAKTLFRLISPWHGRRGGAFRTRKIRALLRVKHAVSSDFGRALLSTVLRLG